jgi:hypothetical protein
MTKRSDDDDPLAREIREIIKLLTHHDRMCAWGGLHSADALACRPAARMGEAYDHWEV